MIDTSYLSSFEAKKKMDMEMTFSGTGTMYQGDLYLATIVEDMSSGAPREGFILETKATNGESEVKLELTGVDIRGVEKLYIEYGLGMRIYSIVITLY